MPRHPVIAYKYEDNEVSIVVIPVYFENYNSYEENKWVIKQRNKAKKEQRSEYNQKWYEDNKEEVKERVKKWNAEHPEKLEEYKEKRRNIREKERKQMI